MKLLVVIALTTVAAAIELSSVDHARHEFYALEQDLWTNVTNPYWVDGDGEYKFAEAIRLWADNINSISTLPSPKINLWFWNNTLEYVDRINYQYKRFMRTINPLGSMMMMSTPNAVLTGNLSVPNTMEKLDVLLEYGDKLLYDLAEEDENEHCASSVFRAKLIYDIYNTVALAELKGYAITQLSWMQLRMNGDGNYTQEITESRERYVRRAARAAAAARSAMTSARREVYMCDPPQHVEGSTYEQVTNLLQGYVENEVDMNEVGTCGDNCPAYSSADRHGCYMDQFCAQQKTCYGKIRECRFVESHMTVCTSSRSSTRRYEWIHYDGGRKLGDVGKCSKETTRVESWYRGFYHCSYCLCLCDDDTYSHRYFSLREATSDVHTNKVVTGIRIVKHDRVFHLQVHEGSLQERGEVEPVGWVPVHKFDPSDIGIYNGVDYHKLTYESRALDLNKMEARADRLLTGVRFRLLYNHLHFEIRTTPFNFTTGRLMANMTRWETSSISRQKLNLDKPDIPTRSPSKLHVDSTEDQYVEFTHSDFDADAAQSTVPFIDVQPVLPSKGAALVTGAGALLRGAAGSGGLVAPRLALYAYERHVAAPPPAAHFTEYREGDDGDGDGDADYFTPIITSGVY